MNEEKEYEEESYKSEEDSVDDDFIRLHKEDNDDAG